MEDIREKDQLIIDEANNLIQRRIVEHTKIDKVSDINLDFIHKLLTSMVYYLNCNPETNEFYAGKFKRHKEKFNLCIDFLVKFKNYPDSPSVVRAKEILTCCAKRVHDIKNLDVSIISYVQGDLIQMLRTVESDANDYFGSYLSDDGSDDEDSQDNKSVESNDKGFFEFFEEILKKNNLVLNDINFIQWLESTNDDKIRNLFLAMAKQITAYPLPANAEEDLRKINQALEKKLPISFDKDGRCVLSEAKGKQYRVPTQFRFCFLRGIGYFDDRFNQASRRSHREYNEVGKPQFSEVILRNVEGVDFYLNFPVLRSSGEEFWEEVRKNAELLRTLLSNLRSSGYVAFRNSTTTYCLFDNMVDFLQYVQTNGIARFYNLIKALLEEKDAEWKKIFLSFGNIFVPSGDLPIHSERYAFGRKEPLRDYALLPRYKKTGQPERPYIGKRYEILCSLDDMLTVQEPDHIWNLRFQKRITVNLTIAPENEVSFLGLIPEGKVHFNSKARFPSFHKPYQAKFKDKYFLNEEQWKACKERIQSVTVNSEEERKIQNGLMQWLMLGNAVKFLWRAFKLSGCATDQPNFFVIFKHPDGTLKHSFPEYQKESADTVRQEIARDIFKKELGVEILYRSAHMVYDKNIQIREVQPDALQKEYSEFVSQTSQSVSPSGQKYPARKDSKVWLASSPLLSSPSPTKKKQSDDETVESPYKPATQKNVQRKPISGSHSEGMKKAGIFMDKTIPAEESTEEAMVAKTSTTLAEPQKTPEFRK